LSNLFLLTQLKTGWLVGENPWTAKALFSLLSTIQPTIDFLFYIIYYFTPLKNQDARTSGHLLILSTYLCRTYITNVQVGPTKEITQAKYDPSHDPKIPTVLRNGHQSGPSKCWASPCIGGKPIFARLE
jgi:hypothetical protein